MRFIIKILVDVFLGLWQFGGLIKKILSAILKQLLWLPLRLIYRLIVLPLYGLYLRLLKKLGWTRTEKNNFWSNLLLNKKLAHILLIALTVVLLFANLTATSDATASEEVVNNTILGQLISDEFTKDEELIEEYLDESAMRVSPNQQQQNNYLRPTQNIATKIELPTLEEFDPNVLAMTVPLGSSGLATEKTAQPRSGQIDYTVQAGDTVSTIAQTFGLSVNTILWANNLTAYSYIKPGQVLLILPQSGVLHQVAKGENLGGIANKYSVGQKEILAANNLQNANQLQIGQKLMIPGGVKPRAMAIAKPGTALRPIFTSPQESAKPIYGSKMNWPTEGHRITQYYSWRHQGVDIANKAGTPVYAADAGVVEFASWNSGGYGNQIVIDHGGGKKTRYAHLTSYSVKAGDVINKGQYIAAMGSTGRSTGSHLHFEVIISGKRYNPLNYAEY